MDAPRPRWSNSTKLIISLLTLAFGVYLLFRFRVIIPPLILAVMLAFILRPLAIFFKKRLHFPQPLAILTSYILLLIIILTIPSVVFPLITAQLAGLELNLQQDIERFEQFLETRNQQFGLNIDLTMLREQAIAMLQGILEPILSQTFNALIEVITSLVWIAFIIMVSYYFIKDGDKFRQWIEGLIPPSYQQDYIRLREEINLIWQHFFKGQLILASIVSIGFTIVGLILGLPFALVMGLLAGLNEFVPRIGHAIWFAIAALLALVLGSTWIHIPNWAFAMIITGCHLLFEYFDANYLIPRIIGRKVHLHPLVVILGIMGGAVFAGVLGILLAAPTIASARVIGRYVYANLFDLDPFPHSVVTALPPPNPRWWQPGKSENSPAETKSEVVE